MELGHTLNSYAHENRMTPAAVVSLSWVRENQAVPACGGNVRAATRAVWSLSERSVAASLPDGSVEFQVLPISWLAQGIGSICAVAAALGLPVAFVAHTKGQESWLPWVFAGGGLVGLAVAPWLIRRRPAVVLQLDRERNWLTADEGQVRVERKDVERLVLVTGGKLKSIPGYVGLVVGSDECLNGALLIVRKSDQNGEEAILTFRYALPGKAMQKIARRAADALGLPLEELKFRQD
jgi:hypothetical protein